MSLGIAASADVMWSYHPGRGMRLFLKHPGHGIMSLGETDTVSPSIDLGSG